MKKFIVFVAFVFSAVGMFASDKAHIDVKEFFSIPGSQWAETTSLPGGKKVDVKYVLTVDAKDNDHAVIDCFLKIPKDFKIISDITGSGFVTVKLKDDSENAALSVEKDNFYNYIEFLLPQKNNHKCEITFQIETQNNGYSLIEFSFEHCQKPFFQRHATAIGVVTGIAAGVVVGVLTFNPGTGAAAGAAAGSAVAGAATAATAGSAVAGAATAATATTATAVLSAVGAGALYGAGAAIIVGGGTTVISYMMKESLQELKSKYSSSKMNESKKTFFININ